MDIFLISKTSKLFYVSIFKLKKYQKLSQNSIEDVVGRSKAFINMINFALWLQIWWKTDEIMTNYVFFRSRFTAILSIAVRESTFLPTIDRQLVCHKICLQDITLAGSSASVFCRQTNAQTNLGDWPLFCQATIGLKGAFRYRQFDSNGVASCEQVSDISTAYRWDWECNFEN